MKRLLALAAAGVILAVASTPAQASLIVQSLPSFNGPALGPSDPYPQPSLTVGTFNYVIPLGDVITSATISGTFGNNVVSTTAGVDLFLDGIFLAQVVKPGPGWSSGPLPWSFTFNPSQFPQLADGTATLTAVQTAEFVIRLSPTTLQIETTPTPEPATLAVFGLMAAGAFGVRRRLKVTA